METERVQSTKRKTPEEWRTAIEQFEAMLERGQPPELSECLRHYRGDQQPLVAELLATYQSYRKLEGVGFATSLAELQDVNPGLRDLIRRSIGNLSTQQFVSRAGKSPAGDRPRQLGNYLLVEPLGRGGFSEVYLACNAKSAEFVVAKMARTDISQPQLAYEALRQEKAALLQLRHQLGIARFVDWYEDRAGTLALITEFVAARPLNRVQESEEVSVRRIVTWMIDLCECLQSAHRAGVHHCDIKPQNVLIDDGTDRPIIIDFGLSQTLLRWSREPPGPAAPVGTLHYLAPEILQNAEHADPRLVDTFGLGAVLYHLLTGRAPFQAANIAEANDRIAHYDAVLSQLDAAPFPVELRDICRQAIAKRPADRYQTPQALRTALLTIPIANPKTSGIGRRASYALLSAACLLVVAAVVASRLDQAVTLGQSKQQQLTSKQEPSVPISRVAHRAQRPVVANEDAPELPSDAPLTELVELHASAPTGTVDEEINLPVVNNWVTRTAAEHGIDLASISREDFRLMVHTSRREVRPWGTREADPNRRGQLIIQYHARLSPLSDAILFRVGFGPWRNSTHGKNNLYCVADLHQSDLDSDGPVELRLGGNEVTNEPATVGPFPFDGSLTKATLADEKEFARQLIFDANRTPCLEPNEIDWRLSQHFSERYSPVVKSLRIGPALNTDLLEVPLVDAAGRSLKSDNQLFLVGRDLNRGFTEIQSSLNDATELWVEIDFSNGQFQAAHRLYKPSSKHTAEAERARQRLARLPENEPLALRYGFNFVPFLFKYVDAELVMLEMGPAPEVLSVQVPVVTESDPDKPSPQPVGLPPQFNKSDRITSRRPYRIPAAYSHNRQPVSPANVPPTWKDVYFRGRFKDGSLTETYRSHTTVYNVGFPLEFVKSAGCPKTEAYAFIYADAESDPSKSVFRNLWLDPTLPPKQTELLHRIRLSVYSTNPNGVAWFEHFADPDLTKPADPIVPGLIYTRYLDRYGRLYGVSTFRLNKDDIEKAVQAFITREAQRN